MYWSYDVSLARTQSRGHVCSGKKAVVHDLVCLACIAQSWSATGTQHRSAVVCRQEYRLLFSMAASLRIYFTSGMNGVPCEFYGRPWHRAFS